MSERLLVEDPKMLSRAKLRARLEQQMALAEFGRVALVESDLEVVLQAAVDCCARSLNADFSKILEYDRKSDTLVFRAGHGWGPGRVGTHQSKADVNSAAGYALHTGEPVLSHDLTQEPRFGRPPLLREFDIRSVINVLIEVEGEAYGVLEVDSPDVGAFEEDDKLYLANFAHHLAAALERNRLHERLTAEMRQSEMLLRELQHRVKNNLQVANSLISMQRRSASTDDGRRQLEMIGSRIGAMQVLFEQLYKRNESAGSTDLGAYLGSLCSNLVDFHGFGGRGIRLDTDIEPLPIEIDRAVPLGLIVNEFIVNSFKHAFPDGSGSVRMTLRPQGPGRAQVRLSDDGVGFDPSALPRQPATGSGLGLKLIEALARQIEGQLHWTNQSGAVLVIDFLTGIEQA